MIASENETVLGPAQDRLHPASISLNARSLWIVQLASVHRTPEVRIEFEVCAAPIPAHRPEERLEMLLDCWVGAVERIPGPPPPAGECHLVRAQRLAVTVFHEPVRM